jgi:hypothetical protein
MNEHMRYVLPTFPFAFVWIGRLVPAMVAVCADRREQELTKNSIGAMLGTSALLWSVCSSLWFYPHNLSYFNEIVGGPSNGWKHLVHSNVDWGQDLLYLQQWVDTHPEAVPLSIGYFGCVKPALAGLSQFGSAAKGALESEKGLKAGWYAVSANLLAGFVHAEYGRDTLKAFRDLQPYECVGGSILIYRVSPPG